MQDEICSLCSETGAFVTYNESPVCLGCVVRSNVKSLDSVSVTKVTFYKYLMFYFRKFCID